jgi:hypothetical protein
MNLRLENQMLDLQMRDRIRDEWGGDILPLLVYMAVVANETTLERWSDVIAARAKAGIHAGAAWLTRVTS